MTKPPEKVEDAPHQLKMLNDYGKAVIAFSGVLLTFAVTFWDKLPPETALLPKNVLVGALLCTLFAELIIGVEIVSCTINVSRHLMHVIGMLYTDDIEASSQAISKVPVHPGPPPSHPTTVLPGEVASTGPTVAGAQQRSLTDKDRAAMTENRRRIKEFEKEAYRWANWSHWGIITVAFIIVLTGILGLVGEHPRRTVGATEATRTATQFVIQQCQMDVSDVRCLEATLDRPTNAFLITLTGKRGTKDVFHIAVDGASGQITQIKDAPK